MNRQSVTLLTRLAVLLTGHFGFDTAATAAAERPTPSATIFAPTSFWYTPLPADVPLHGNSPNFAAEFVRQKKAYYGTVSINLTSYASPEYRADANTATVRVAEWDCQKKGFSDPKLAEQWKAVPIPAYAEPADGTDAEMTIYQPSSDTLWEFWQARRINGQWQACWGGCTRDVSKSQGIWHKPYGTTATGLPFLGELRQTVSGQAAADRRPRLERLVLDLSGLGRLCRLSVTAGESTGFLGSSQSRSPYHRSQRARPPLADRP